MKTMTGHATPVSVCEHCGGTGICRHGVVRTDFHHEWLECEQCGRGVPGIAGDSLEQEEHGPVCSVCGGKGYGQFRGDRMHWGTHATAASR